MSITLSILKISSNELIDALTTYNYTESDKKTALDLLLKHFEELNEATIRLHEDAHLTRLKILTLQKALNIDDVKVTQVEDDDDYQDEKVASVAKPKRATKAKATENIVETPIATELSTENITIKKITKKAKATVAPTIDLPPVDATSQSVVATSQSVVATSQSVVEEVKQPEVAVESQNIIETPIVAVNKPKKSRAKTVAPVAVTETPIEPIAEIVNPVIETPIELVTQSLETAPPKKSRAKKVASTVVVENIPPSTVEVEQVTDTPVTAQPKKPRAKKVAPTVV